MKISLTMNLFALLIFANGLLLGSNAFTVQRSRISTVVSSSASVARFNACIPVGRNTGYGFCKMMTDGTNVDVTVESNHLAYSKEEELVTSFQIAATIGTLVSILLLPTSDVLAGGSEYGILAGRSASMLHPVTMLLLFGTSIYSGYLGLQWRKLRGLSEEIKELQQQAPRLSTGMATFPLSLSIQAINDKMKSAEQSEMTALQKDLQLLNSAQELDTKIDELKALRSSLQKADLKDKHHNTGSVLLSVGVSVSLLGAFNTYMRAGKLFPGPHLYAGMGCTALWAIAAALVPAMQKGNEAARIGHIGLNVVNILLFGWQVVTGLDIMFKVWEKTSWP